MRAIIVSAGQGRRLLPLTLDTPKCLLPVVDGRSLLEVQLQALAECGIDDVTVMVGFGADQVEQALSEHTPPGMTSRSFFNPFFASSDNLITVWLARAAMLDEFVLLNGDTLFESEILRRLLTAPRAPLTLAINVKNGYDDDDMKVSLDLRGRLTAVGKTLKPKVVDGESIGMMVFRNSGVEPFRSALEMAVRDPNCVDSWYLSVINGMAAEVPIQTTSIRGLWWGEVDSREDLEAVRVELADRRRPNGGHFRLPEAAAPNPHSEAAGR
jgi:choline kinase